MSFAHLGYPVASVANMGPQATSVTSRASPKSPPGSPCCETGRPIATDPVTGQTVCSCQYGPASAALYNYPRVPGLPEAFYNQAAMAAQAAQLQQLAAAADPGSLYSGLGSPYDFKGISAPGLYPYDPALAAYPYAAGFLDPNARRKNATRESTQTLKAWLSEHKKNPYPTKGEKIMLAIITKMTLTQVSTWFANARRRLKKENKMTWEPRNRMDDDDDDGINSDIEDNDKKDDEDENISVDSDDDEDASNNLRNSLINASIAAQQQAHLSNALSRPNYIISVPNHTSHLLDNSENNNRQESQNSEHDNSIGRKDNNSQSLTPTATDKSSTTTTNNNTTKPKIWSMAEIATSSSSNDKNDSENSRSSPLSKEHMHKMPSIISQGLHPAWRGAAHHPYLHPHFAQRLAAFPTSTNVHPLAGVAAAAAAAAAAQQQQHQGPPYPHPITTTSGGGGPPTRHHFLPAFTSLPQLRPNDSTGSHRVSAFSPPASATSPSTQAQRNV